MEMQDGRGGLAVGTFGMEITTDAEICLSAAGIISKRAKFT
jgi:hypothetical protein